MKISIPLKNIINVNICIIGIECSWAMFLPNASAIFLFLGAHPDWIAYLWLLPPLMGLIISPIIGHMSDLTVSDHGKRKPYIFFGLLATCLLSFLVPFASILWFGIIIISMLIAFINIAHNPMRALAADVIPKHQLNLGFAVQTIFIAVGALLGSAMPYFLKHSTFFIPGMHQPPLLSLGFFISGLLVIATGLWTCLTVKEGYLDDIAESEVSFLANLKEIVLHIFDMPKILRQICVVQFIMWIGFFVLFAYFSLSIAQTKFGLPPGVNINNNPQYALMMEQATAYNSLCFIFFQLSNLATGLAIPFLTLWIQRKTVLTAATIIGGVGMLSLLLSPTSFFIAAGTALGIAWGASLSIHLAMIGSNLPKKKMGLYTGIFPVSICVSQILTGIIVGPIIKYLLNESVIELVSYSGITFLIAAIFNQFIDDRPSLLETPSR